MGFMRDADEQRELEEMAKKLRHAKVETIAAYCEENHLVFDDVARDKILHPENYNDWGYRRHFSN